ncbi:MAG TPA: glycosyltransferase [Microbacterium sp.]|nr:glycosyltransferase [Microbacterium sp.]
MRIAIVTDYYLPTLGGVQTAIKAQREALTAAGHRVTIFAPLTEEPADPDIVRLPSARGFAPDGYPFAWPLARIVAMLRAEFAGRGIDVVHVQTEMFAALAGIRAAREGGIPLVQTMHGRIDVYTRSVLPLPVLTVPLLARLHRRALGSVPEPLRDPSVPWARSLGARRMWQVMVSQANAADRVIVPSAHFAAKLAGQGVTTPLTVLSNGLEDSVVDAIGEPRARTLSPGSRLRVMWCGRVSPEKRPDVFVDAISRTSGVTAEMYGDGVARRSVARRAHSLPTGRLTVHGGVPQERVLAAMREAHVFVSSSWDFDNQPMVLLEAIASGLPVIVADADLAESLPEGSFLVAPSPDAVGLSRALRALCENPGVVARMSTAAIAGRDDVWHASHTAALVGVYEGVAR